MIVPRVSTVLVQHPSPSVLKAHTALQMAPLSLHRHCALPVRMVHSSVSFLSINVVFVRLVGIVLAQATRLQLVNVKLASYVRVGPIRRMER